MSFDRGLNVFCVLMLAIVITILSHSDRQRSDFEDNKYCAMVEVFDSSGGVNGWPAYRDEVDCSEIRPN